MQQLEFGEHVSSKYTSIFKKLYRQFVVEPQLFLRIQNEHALMENNGSSISSSNGGEALSSLSSKGGRKRLDPDKIAKMLEEEKRKRTEYVV